MAHSHFKRDTKVHSAKWANRRLSEHTKLTGVSRAINSPKFALNSRVKLSFLMWESAICIFTTTISGTIVAFSNVAWQNYHRKSTDGVSIAMLYMWYIGNMLYGAYAVASNLYFGLIIQPQLFALFTLVNILQVYWYRYKWNTIKVSLSCFVLCALYAGAHVGIWKGEVHAMEKDQSRVVTFLGVLPAIFIAVGFFPEFHVCIKEKSVEMSNFFLMLDISGGVFSTVSLAFDHEFDYIASITYLVVVLLDLVLASMKLYYYIKGTQGANHGSANTNNRDTFVDGNDNASVESVGTKKSAGNFRFLEEGTQ